MANGAEKDEISRQRDFDEKSISGMCSMKTMLTAFDSPDQ